jgi:hypothetical protein
MARHRLEARKRAGVEPRFERIAAGSDVLALRPLPSA